MVDLFCPAPMRSSIVAACVTGTSICPFLRTGCYDRLVALLALTRLRPSQTAWVGGTLQWLLGERSCRTGQVVRRFHPAANARLEQQPHRVAACEAAVSGAQCCVFVPAIGDALNRTECAAFSGNPGKLPSGRPEFSRHQPVVAWTRPRTQFNQLHPIPQRLRIALQRSEGECFALADQSRYGRTVVPGAFSNLRLRQLPPLARALSTLSRKRANLGQPVVVAALNAWLASALF